MYPATIVLPDELSEAYAAFALHLYDEIEEPAMVFHTATDEVGSTSDEVMAMGGTAHQVVEFIATIATTDEDGAAPRFAYGIEQLLYQHMQQVISALRWAIVDALALRGGAGAQFVDGEIFHDGDFIDEDEDENEDFLT